MLASIATFAMGTCLLLLLAPVSVWPESSDGIGDVTAPLTYLEARRGAPDPLHIQAITKDDETEGTTGPEGQEKNPEKFPIKFETINICTNEYKINSKTAQIVALDKCLPGFKRKLNSPRVVVFKRPENVAGTPLNLLLISLDPNFLPTYNVYKVCLDCQRPKYDLILPETTETSKAYKFEPEQQYLLEIGLSPNIPPGNWSNVGDYTVIFTKDTNTLESRFSDPVWEGKDVKYPHFGNEFAKYKATMQPEGAATLFAEKKEVSLGVYNPTLCCPFYNSTNRSFSFFWLDGARNGCPDGFPRKFSITLMPIPTGSDLKDDQKNGEMIFPKECYYNLIFKNGKLKDIAEHLVCDCKMKPVQEC